MDNFIVTQIKDENHNLDKRISLLGCLIDNGIDDMEQENLEKSIQLATSILPKTQNVIQRATLNYFIANAYSGIRSLKKENTDNDFWENTNLEKELIHLRYAFACLKEDKIQNHPTDLEFRIATNLGNVLSHIGRFSESLEYWDYVLIKFPAFAMARGNKGYCLCYYSKILYDQGHKVVFLWHAKNNLRKALDGHLESEAKEDFKKLINTINSILKDDKEVSLKEYPLGRSKKEKDYRTWVLENRLFLNPLNDLGNKSIAATDVLTLPSIITSEHRQPQLYGLYNQIKQSYVSARFILYEGIKGKDSSVHFSDKNVLLYNTFDYPAYGLNIEKIKIAFLNAYSILDKIAFLLNHYFKLGIPPFSISFRTIWYEKHKNNLKLRAQFLDLPIWPLRGLFWLSKDFYEKDTDFKEALEPDAKELNDIRNHIAHKYLKVHDEYLWREDLESYSPMEDKICYSIRRNKLEGKTIKLFKLVRNALIYSALSIHINELFIKKKLNDEIILPIPLDAIEDAWKV